MTESVHEFVISTSWKGTTGTGYSAYDRSHLGSVATHELPLTAAPAFLGVPDQANPEQLLASAVSSCQLLSFLAVAARSNVDVVEYRDNAHGYMSESDQPMS